MELIREFTDFMDKCPTPYQFGDVISNILIKNSYTRLEENEKWPEAIPEKGFFLRDGRALVAWQMGGLNSACVVGTHNDSPCLKLKPNFAFSKDYPQARVATYGGGLWYTWMDRELRIAGRVTAIVDNEPKFVLFDSKKPVAMIPSKPPHFDAEVGLSPKFNAETGLNPVFGCDPSISLTKFISFELGIEESNILDYDLSFVDGNPPAIIGARSEFVSSMRIDNLGSTFCALKAFLDSTPKDVLNVFVVFDHEEVGSASHVGAKSDLLFSFFERVVGTENLPSFIAKSLVISSDNAHAYHPNFMEKYEDLHSPILGNGVVLKRSPGANYATDIVSEYPLRRASEVSNSPLQFLINRNDIIGGSTIGPHVSTILGIPTVDIGLPQLSMHSIRELVASKDVEYLIELLKVLYNDYESYRLQ